MDQTYYERRAIIVGGLAERAADLTRRIASATFDASTELKLAASNGPNAPKQRSDALSALATLPAQLAEVQALITAALALSK